MKWPSVRGVSGSVLFCSLQWISLTRKLKLARPCFLCNLFKTLHAFGYLVISKNYVKIKLCLLLPGMYSFQSFVSDSVWFPPAAQCLCEGFFCFQQPCLKYIKTTHLVFTLPQSCLHLKATQWQETMCIFPESRVCSATTRKDILFLLKQTPCFLTD